MTSESDKLQPRRLIVNADDFGLSPGVNRGILECHRKGIVTSASLMVRHEAAREAAEMARAHRALGVGLHIDLGEWAYRDEEWVPVYEVVDLSDDDAVWAEVEAQIEAFQSLMGTDPTHFDSHQHVHERPNVRRIVVELAVSFGAPIRQLEDNLRYCGQFYGQDLDGTSHPQRVSTEALCKILARLPPGYTELACHPGYADDLDTMYRTERALEVRALTDPLVRVVLEAAEIELITFREWKV